MSFTSVCDVADDSLRLFEPCDEYGLSEFHAPDLQASDFIGKDQFEKVHNKCHIKSNTYVLRHKAMILLPLVHTLLFSNFAAHTQLTLIYPPPRISFLLERWHIHLLTPISWA